MCSLRHDMRPRIASMITELEFKIGQQLATTAFADGRGLADPKPAVVCHLKLAHPKTAASSAFAGVRGGGERFGRYSFIGLLARTPYAPAVLFDVTEVVTDGVVVETSRQNPLDFISDYQSASRWRYGLALPGAAGGLFWLRRGALHRKSWKNPPARHLWLP
jgi:anthranilate synthase component 1